MKCFSWIALVISLISISLLTACIYHSPVQQGNDITQQQLKQLHKGMPKEEVISLLGTPILAHNENDHLIYVYTFQSGHKKKVTNHTIINLRNNRVTSIWTDKNSNSPPRLATPSSH